MVVTSSGCSDYDAEEAGVATDRFYVGELIEDVDGSDHVTVSTHYGQLRGTRISGIPEAGACPTTFTVNHRCNIKYSLDA